MSNILKKDNRISGIGLLSIILFIILMCVVSGIYIEKYLEGKENKIFFRIMLFTLMLNISILIFLIYSFSKVKFVPGPRGPSGIRGRTGLIGSYDTVEKCKKQSKTLGDEYLDKLKAETIVIQRPVLGFNDKY
jgi:hypothetical protein